MKGRRNNSDLPHKECAVCGRPFAWRKKWARDWAEVKYCSERCRRQRGAEVRKTGSGPAGPTDSGA